MRSTTIVRRRLTVSVAAVLLLAACGGGDAGDAGEQSSATDMASDPATMSDEEMMSDEDMASDEEMMSDEDHDDAEEMDDAEGMDEEDAAGEPAGVLGVTATAPDGSTFRIADFDGPVLVETFATWCSNCRAQLGDTQQAAAEAGDGAVFLALSVETTLDPAALAGYADENGFDDIRFGVLDDASLVTLQDEFGGAVLSPPSTPKFRVDGGAVSDLTTGFESADEILASLGG